MMVFDFVRTKTEEFSDFLDRRAKEDQETLKRFTEGLAKTRDQLLSSLVTSFDLQKTGDLEAALLKLEEGLLAADVGFETAEKIINDVRVISKRSETNFVSDDDVKAVLRGRMLQVLTSAGAPTLNLGVRPAVPIDAEEEEEQRRPPAVILVLGANGMGKTTTIGKLARRLRVEGEKRVLLAACDTFRAAAVEQLEAWASRADVDIVTPDVGVSSPALAAGKAMDVALRDDYDVVVVDTAGRLANNYRLNEELKKIKKTVRDKLALFSQSSSLGENNNLETLIVVDANVGRNALDQARVWRDEVGATGLCVTKLDGTSRAGFVIGVVQDLGVPVKLVGVGEGLDDLRDFDPEGFVDSLLNLDKPTSLALAKRFDELGVQVPAFSPTTTATAATSSSSLESSSSESEVDSSAIAAVAEPPASSERVPPRRPTGGNNRGGTSAKKKKKKKNASRRR